MKNNDEKSLIRDEWIKNTAVFYYAVFSAKYHDVFLLKLLKGGGGNSTLCASWMQLYGKFQKRRISESAVKLLKERNIPFINDAGTIKIKKKLLSENHSLFSSNEKGVANRILAGKALHFDHNPSNKLILNMLNNKVIELNSTNLSYKHKIDILSVFISTIQTIDLITIEQDEIRTKADRCNPLSRDIRDKILEENFLVLIIE